MSRRVLRELVATFALVVVTLGSASAAPAGEVSRQGTAVGSATRLMELVGRRDAFTRQFLNTDGTVTAVISSRAVLRPEGKDWAAIQRGFSKIAQGRAFAGGTYSMSLPRRLGGSGITLRFGRSSLRLRAPTTGAASFGTQHAAYPLGRDAKLLVVGNPDRANADFLIERPSAAALKSLRIQLQSRDLRFRLDRSSTRLIVRHGRRVIGSLSAPLMRDAGGASSSAVRLSARIGRGTATVRVVPDLHWLRDARREYPVLVDPDATFGTAADTYVSDELNCSSYCYMIDANYGSELTASASYFEPPWYQSTIEHQALLRFDTSSIPADNVVDSAVLNVSVSAYGDDGPDTQAIEAGAEWSEGTVTYFTRPPYYRLAGTGTLLAGTRSAIDVTPAVNRWVNRAPNYGLYLVPSTLTYHVTAVATKENGDYQCWPENGGYACEYRGDPASVPTLVVTYEPAGTPPEEYTCEENDACPGADPDDVTYDNDGDGSGLAGFRSTATRTASCPVPNTDICTDGNFSTWMYSFNSCPANVDEEVDPVGAVFYGYGTADRALNHIQHHTGWGIKPTRKQNFQSWGSCGKTYGERASARFYGDNSYPPGRYHVRIRRTARSDSQWGITATATPHHEDYIGPGREPLHWKCIHAVDKGGIHQGSDSGFDQGRRKLVEKFDGASDHNTSFAYWGNTREFHQCDGDSAGSHGSVAWISVPNFYH